MPDKRKSEAYSKVQGTERPASGSAEKTVIKGLGLSAASVHGSASCVDVKDGKIIRIRPLHYDWKYTKEEIGTFKLEARGKVFEPILKSTPPYYSFAWKKRVYSPNRVKYPLKRVDWDPDGERNPQNRGKSKFKRISWDEATDIVASEVRRIQKEYGPLAILAMGEGHGQTKLVHSPHACQMALLDKMGGYTLQIRNADSWEGWYWGAQHVWGCEDGIGLQTPKTNLFKDVSEHSELLVWWGSDPETTYAGFAGHFASRELYWFTELGIKQVWICPDLNYSAAIHADKWIPVLPNTDAALQLAIAYIWMTEGTYDKRYIDTHVVGFDKFEDYVLGKEDGVPKTPEWASPKCGIAEWTIKALAREWVSKTTSVAHHYGGGYIRGPFSHEPARLEICLLGMQGLGRPGVNQFNLAAPPVAEELPRLAVTIKWPDFLFASRGGHMEINIPAAKQRFPKTLTHHAILNPPVSFWGNTCISDPIENQFIKYTYPIPKEKGGTEVHMIWTDTPCRATCWNVGSKTVETYRSPKIECIVAQHPWLENDCYFADIILPVTTKMEEEDVAVQSLDAIRAAWVERQAIGPVGESKPDDEVVGEVAKKLNKYEEYTEGRTPEEEAKRIYNYTGANNFISLEDLTEKEYAVFPVAPDWKNDPPGLIKFYEDPENNPLHTPSGKLEFYSERIAQNFPYDDERPPIPKWIEKSVTHDERISSERAKKYPLLQISNHGRWRVHAQCDDINWSREAPTCKIKGDDGYMYEPLWINTSDASERGINDGDIVKVHNERGIVLGGAYVSERIRPGAVSMDHGARVDWIAPGEIDRGGAINLISPDGIISKHCAGMATSSYLVQVERLSMAEMDEWRKQYPEAFSREYDPASGLRFNAWVED